MGDLYTTEGFCSGENQKANILKIGADSWRAVVLSSKARARKEENVLSQHKRYIYAI
jgi:hypothetical protein